MTESGETMKALFFKNFGSAKHDVFGDFPRPKEDDLEKGELLLKMRAASVNPVDVMARTGAMPKFFAPKAPVIHGLDFVGEVIAVNNEESDFKVGDVVFGFTNYVKKEHLQSS